MNWKKWALTWATIMVVGFYSTFVLQTLWNWFAVEAFHVPAVSYWTMYGFMMLIHLLTDKSDFQNEERAKRMGILVMACVPEHKLSEVREEIKVEDDDIGIKLFGLILGQVAGSSTALFLGWTIHTFLV
jgi:hypothetical protein